MASLNKAMLIGNVGKDPEIRSLLSGGEVANLTIATSESWKDKITGEKKEKTEWHNITIFNPNLVALVKNYVKKGSKLYIDGAIQTREYTDKAGVEKYTTEIVLSNFNGQIVLLGGKQSDDTPQPKTAADLDDSIPF